MDGTRKRATFEDRFWAKVNKLAPDECWPWTAYIDQTKGYGQISRGGRGSPRVASSRAAYEIAYGDIPDGMHIDHTCHNGSGCFGGPDCKHRACCNPAHLEAVTQQENIARGNCGIHQTLRTHCPLGHEYTPDNIFNNNGGRGCKKCRVIWGRRSKQKRKNAA
jgi:hypothetical protein